MGSQTISLFRYLMLGILNLRLLALVVILVALGALFSGFITELAIINSQQIAEALLADILRYSLVVLILLVVITNVSEDFQFRQFERLLTMPVSRWQYIVAQFILVAILAGILCLPVFLVISMSTSVELGLYWAVAIWLEMMLVGLVGLLAILSLEKIPLAVFFSLAIYLLAKLSGLISQMISESVRLSDGSVASRVTEMIFNGILYVIPRLEAFAQNDVFFDRLDLLPILSNQLITFIVYAMFLLGVCMIDFYRKEFNL